MLLRSEDILRVDRGVGNFVAASPIRCSITTKIRFNEALEAQERKSEYQLLYVSDVPADVSIAAKIGVEPGQTAVKVGLSRSAASLRVYQLLCV